MSCAKIILVALLLAVGASSYAVASPGNTLMQLMFFSGTSFVADGSADLIDFDGAYLIDYDGAYLVE